MAHFSEEIKKKVWEKAQSVEGFNPSMYRKDACGAWIVWDRYGMQDNIYGWEIDHVVPQTLLRSRQIPQYLIDAPLNLRAMQHSNNESKGDDFPSYISAVTSQGNTNVEKQSSLRINDSLRNELIRFYNL